MSKRTVYPRRFTITAEHLRLLPQLNIGWDPEGYGSPGADNKRPYGNSDVERDLARILSVPLEEDESGRCDEETQCMLLAVHASMQEVLEILVQHAATGIRAGEVYVQKGACEPWVREM